MSITITHLHGVDNWQMTVASGDVTEGTAEDILRSVAEHMHCKVNITEQRVKTLDFAEAYGASPETLRLIAERNADGRHPIG